MLRLLVAILVGLVLELALATYVVTRAWYYRPARLLTLPVVALVLLNIGLFWRVEAQTLSVAQWSFAGEALGWCVLDGTLLLLFASLFVPKWLEEPRAIKYILLPYALAFIVIALDTIGDFRWFIASVAIRNGSYSPVLSYPGGPIMLWLFSLSWLPHLGVLIYAWRSQPRARFTALLLGVPIVFAIFTFRVSNETIRLYDPRFSFLQTLPLLLALTYAVFHSRIFEPTRAAIDLALQAMDEAVAVVNRDAIITFSNAQAAMLGLKPQQSLNASLIDAGAMPSDLSTLLGGEILVPGTRRHTFPLGHPPRLFDLSLTPVTDPDGAIRGMLLLGRDVTEIERRNVLLEEERRRLADVVQQLAYLASHDPLTGLPNRRSFSEALERVVARARRGQVSGLLFIDLDNFKTVNDTLGHAAGDSVLVSLTGILTNEVREMDMLARIGGDEFAVLLEGTTVDQALHIAERMRHAVQSTPWYLDNHSFDLSLSIGVVDVDGHYDVNTILSHADNAMYTAKHQGRNRVIIHRRKNS